MHLVLAKIVLASFFDIHEQQKNLPSIIESLLVIFV